MGPPVTIAIPTVERLGYLKEAVGSALAQDYPHVEILIGDDGDSEGMREWCEALAGREPRVSYRRNGRRLGLAGNWNALADAARGEFIVIIGDDDRLLPGFVSGLMAAASPANGGRPFDVAFANHYLIDGGGLRLERESREGTRYFGRHLLAAGEVAEPARAVWRNSVPMSAALVRTSFVRRLRFKEDLNTPELELFARMAEEGARFVFVPDYLAEYRAHAGSETAAGLRLERLAERLSEVRVGPAAEGYKREFMAGLLVSAVSRCLERGDTERARRLLGSEYYPAPWRGRRGLKFSVSVCLQGACAALPAPVGARAFRLARQVKAGLNL